MELLLGGLSDLVVVHLCLLFHDHVEGSYDAACDVTLFGPALQLRIERRWLLSSSLRASETIPSHGFVPLISLSLGANRLSAFADVPGAGSCILVPSCSGLGEERGGGAGGEGREGRVLKSNFGSFSETSRLARFSALCDGRLPCLGPAAPLLRLAAPFPPLRHAVKNENSTGRDTRTKTALLSGVQKKTIRCLLGHVELH